MDYAGFYEFPFPSVLSPNDTRLKEFFSALPDDEQLKLLNGSHSYEEFNNRIVQYMRKESFAPS